MAAPTALAPVRTDGHLWGLLLLVGTLVVFSGATWLQTPGAPYGDDNSAHFALAVHLSRLMQAGHTDLWWHPSNFGVPLFAAYQPLPGIGMGAVLAVLGGVLPLDVLFKASILLPWALMPLAWGKGGRMLGLSRETCLLLGALTLAVHDPDAIGFSVRSSTVRGLYTQHFGLLLLPLAVGAVWRRADGQAHGVLPAAVTFSLLVLSHLWVGLYGALSVAALLVAEPRYLVRRLRRLVPVVCVSAAVLAPWLLPLLATNDHAGGLPWLHETHNGWPLARSVRLLLTGAVFDTGRLPWLTVPVAVGAVGLVLRVGLPGARRWVVLAVGTGLLFLGRTNLGALYDLLPLHGQVNVMRYITGVHVCGLVAAAVALGAGVRAAEQHWGARPASALLLATTAGAAALGLLVLAPSLKTFDPNQPAYAGLAEHLRQGPDTRFAVHERLGTASHFHRDLLPLLADRGQLQSYAHGYHCTMSTYYAEFFDFSPAAAELAAVGAVVARKPLPDDFPAESWPERWENDRYVVLRQPAGAEVGWFSFSAVQGGIRGPDLRALRPAVRALAVPAWTRGVSPALDIDPTLEGPVVVGADGTPLPWDPDQRRSLLDHLAPETRAERGEVLGQSRGLSAYHARVRVPEGPPRWLVLKANAFPWWHATVDGEPVQPTTVATNFQAVPVPAGDHEIAFAYRNPPAQKLGAVMGFGVVLAWPIGWLWRHRRGVAVSRRRRMPPGESGGEERLPPDP